MSRLVQYLTFATALGCGLSAGVFFAFSSFVMPALDRLAPAQSIRAMNSINKLAVTPGLHDRAVRHRAGLRASSACGPSPRGASAPPRSCSPAARSSSWAPSWSPCAANVPLNDALMKVDPEAADAATRWSSYLSDWTAWNHARAVTAIAASGLLIAALRVSP